MEKQPFYRNKVAMLLRVFSCVNLITLMITFWRVMYWCLILGWEPGFKSTLYLVFDPFVVLISEMLRTKAVDYGTRLFNEKSVDQED